MHLETTRTRIIFIILNVLFILLLAGVVIYLNHLQAQGNLDRKVYTIGEAINFDNHTVTVTAKRLDPKSSLTMAEEQANEESPAVRYCGEHYVKLRTTCEAYYDWRDTAHSAYIRQKITISYTVQVKSAHSLEASSTTPIITLATKRDPKAPVTMWEKPDYIPFGISRTDAGSTSSTQQWSIWTDVDRDDSPITLTFMDGNEKRNVEIKPFTD
ncbi:hypothetical protein D3C86_1465600 [compost metagenome]